MKALLPYLVDPTAARAYLESIRWPLATVCPHCRASGGAGRLEARPGRVRVGAWKCYRCKQQFTVTINTLFEDSKLPLHMWLQAMELLCRSRQGVSAQMLQFSEGTPTEPANRSMTANGGQTMRRERNASSTVATNVGP
jgi:transposase-like protein